MLVSMPSRYLSPAGSTKRGQMVSDGRSEHTRLLSSKPSSAYAPRLGRRAARGLSGTVYRLRILPLRAENALRQ